MATVIRPEVSRKNKNWIDRHRYYELKHFCLQYPQWKKELRELDGYSRFSPTVSEQILSGSISSPVESTVELRSQYLDKIKMVDDAVAEAALDLEQYLLVGITEGYSYEKLKARLEIPCCKDVYYDMYRRFFYLLDKARK